MRNQKLLTSIVIGVWLTTIGHALADDGFESSIAAGNLTSRASDHTALKLSRPDSARAGTSIGSPRGAAGDADHSNRAISGWWTSVGGLSLVVIAILLCARFLRRWLPKTPSVLPEQALEMLGRFPVDPKNNIYLVRCGSRILMLSATADGLRTLSEISDVGEVASLMRLCGDNGDISSLTHTGTGSNPETQYAVLRTQHSAGGAQPRTTSSATQRLQERLRKSANTPSAPEMTPTATREVPHA